MSLALIHIYVTPIKRFLQALWAAGFCGGLLLALTQARNISSVLPGPEIIQFQCYRASAAACCWPSLCKDSLVCD